MSPASAIYVGRVRHRRFAPVAHSFEYPLFLMYLDLAELPEVFDGVWGWSARRPAPAWFRRADYLGPAEQPLDVAVRDRVAAETGRRPSGPVRLLTHLRYFGHCFNPISLYYCFTPDGSAVEAVVAEVTNTPWGERHAYVLDERNRAGSSGTRYRFPKAMHVSPFMGMDVTYDLATSLPGERLTVHLANLEAGRRTFDATLALSRRPLSQGALTGVLVRHPAHTLRLLLGIYVQALRLWWKGAPVFDHPRTHTHGRPGSGSDATSPVEVT